MSGWQHQWSEFKDLLMTRLANRTFKRNPGLIDRLAISVISKMTGPVAPDPELEHDELLS